MTSAVFPCKGKATAKGFVLFENKGTVIKLTRQFWHLHHAYAFTYSTNHFLAVKHNNFILLVCQMRNRSLVGITI